MGKNGRILFDRPKPIAGCSASGRRRRIPRLMCWADISVFYNSLIMATQC
jgi:hypothetical protein